MRTWRVYEMFAALDMMTPHDRALALLTVLVERGHWRRSTIYFDDDFTVDGERLRDEAVAILADSARQE